MAGLTYTEAAYQLGIGQKSIEELGKEFATLGKVTENIILTPSQQAVLEVFHDAAETLFINPIKNNSKVAKNTAAYVTGGDNKTLKYDVTSGASSFSAYLQSNQEAITGRNLNTADYNVLSQLSYASKWSSDADYQRVINKENISVKEYCTELLKHGDQLSNVDRQYLQELSESQRFSGLTIDHSIGNTDTGDGKLTRVLVFNSGDGHAIVSVQGTNGKVDDWKTNGEFVESRPTDEEMWVASVVDTYVKEYTSIDLTGHSQGGREAITTGILLSPENQCKITRIVSNDGPGYSQAFMTRYSQQIGAIEGKVLNIRPADSVVGELLTGIGEVQYVEVIDVIKTNSVGAEENCYHHEGITWYIDENGNYVTTDGHDLLTWTTASAVTPYVAEALLTVLPEERVSYYLGKIMELGGDENRNLKGECFLKSELGEYISLIEEFKADFETHLDNIASTQLSEDEYLFRGYCKEVADICGEIGTALTVAKVSCLVLAAIFPEAAPVIAVIYAAVKSVKLVVTIVGAVFRAIEYYLNYQAIKRAQKKKQERYDYINGPRGEMIDVSVNLIYEAANKLQEAQYYMSAAYSDYQSMLHHFQGKLRAAIAEGLGADEEETEKWSGVSSADAQVHCWFKGVRNFDRAALSLSKANNIVKEIAVDSQKIIADNGGDWIFTVYPSRLSAAAGKGASCQELINKELGNIESGVNDLGSFWKGDDYDSIKGAVPAPIEKCKEYSQALGDSFNSLIQIAEKYSSYQETTIEKFQNINLDFA